MIERARTGRIATVTLGLLCLLGVAVALKAEPTPEIRYEMSLAKDRFAAGEPVEVSFTWTNLAARAVCLERWRGPTSGVTVQRSEGSPSSPVYDFAVARADGRAEERLEYRGGFACGGAVTYELLELGASLTRRSVVNAGIGAWHSGYDLSAPGRYVLRSRYMGSFGEGASPPAPRWEPGGATSLTVDAEPVRLTVHPLDAEGLARNREALRAGDTSAVAIAAAHQDLGSVDALIQRSRSAPAEREVLVALVALGTDPAVEFLGERALAAVSRPDSDPVPSSSLAKLLSDTRSPVAVPYFREMLLHDGWSHDWGELLLHEVAGEPEP